MEDPVEIRCRMEVLARRVNRRDDYGALLAAGELVLDISEVDPPQWRARIRAQTRADEIKIQIGQSNRIVWAMLQQPFDQDARMKEAANYMRAIDQIFEAAKGCGHDPRGREGRKFGRGELRGRRLESDLLPEVFRDLLRLLREGLETLDRVEGRAPDVVSL